jgi:hypothetical protein
MANIRHIRLVCKRISHLSTVERTICLQSSLIATHGTHCTPVDTHYICSACFSGRRGVHIQQQHPSRTPHPCQCTDMAPSRCTAARQVGARTCKSWSTLARALVGLNASFAIRAHHLRCQKKREDEAREKSVIGLGELTAVGPVCMAMASSVPAEKT